MGLLSQVPGIAIAQLSRVDDIDAVLVTRWEWDGGERRRGTEPGARTGLPGAAADHVGEYADGLVSALGEPQRTGVVDGYGASRGSDGSDGSGGSGGSGGQGSLWT
ncbi:hypothetical protein L1856_34455 [Streptomyces sp. Tue 6430]|nr:hypothetical protein [Streptomyces sp. Tue 6430]